MGIGFVLIAWLAIFLILSFMGGLAFALVIYFFNRKTKSLTRWARTAVSFVYPFIMTGYIGASFIVWAFWCEGVRKVDPGIGDGWHILIHNGYQLGFIDVFEQGFINDPGDNQVLFDVLKLDSQNPWVFGVGGDKKDFFLLNTQSKTLKTTHSGSEWQKWLESEKIENKRELPTAEAYYYEHRIIRSDYIVSGFLALGGLIVSILWFWLIKMLPNFMESIVKWVPDGVLKKLRSNPI